MKYLSIFLSIVFLCALNFSGAKSFMMNGKQDCCKTSHCDTKKKEKGCDQKENCANFCCVNMVATATQSIQFDELKQLKNFRNKIDFRNDHKINNNGLPFFHPPSKI